jgi:hypothetical protein
MIRDRVVEREIKLDLHSCNENHYTMDDAVGKSRSKSGRRAIHRLNADPMNKELYFS